MSTIIIKNNSGSNISLDDLGGLLILDSTQITASDLFIDGRIYESDDLKTQVASGDLVINDGSSDLSISDALSYLTSYNYSLFQPIISFNESVDDRVSNLIQDGTGLSWAYNDGLNTLTGNVSLSSFSTTDLSEGTSLYYTDTRVDTRVQGESYNITGSWTFNTSLPTSSLTPSLNNELVTKEYVDNLVQGLDWQNSVLDRDLVTSPISPSSGDRYIISGIGGDWSTGTINDIAEWNGTAWIFETPNEGFASWIEDENILVVYNGSSWITFSSATSHNNLSGLQGGTTNQYYHLTSSQHTEITTFFASTDISASEAETLTDGSNADSLHIHSSTGISDFSEAVDDRVASLILEGNNITISYNDPSNSLTIDCDITNFTDLNDTPSNYSGTTSGDFVVVNGTTDGLIFSTINIVDGSGIDNQIARWDGTGSIQGSGFSISDTSQLLQGSDERIDASGGVHANGILTSFTTAAPNSFLAAGATIAATKDNSICIGDVTSNGSYNIVIGKTTTTTSHDNMISIGRNHTYNLTWGSNIDQSVMIGYLTQVNSFGNIAIGSSTRAERDNTIAIGTSAYATGSNSIAIGSSSLTSSSDNSIAIGRSSSSSGIAIGYLSNSSADNSIAIGYNTLSRQDCVCIGYQNRCTSFGVGSVSVGPSITHDSNQVSLFGSSVSVTSSGVHGGTAIGYSSTCGVNSTALGREATSTHDRSVALGYQSVTTGADQIMMGKSTHIVYIPGSLTMTLNVDEIVNTIRADGVATDTKLPTEKSVRDAIINTETQLEFNFLVYILAWGGS